MYEPFLPQKYMPSKEIEKALQQFWDIVKMSGELIVSLQEDNASLSQKVAGIEDLFDGKKVEQAALNNRLKELQQQIDGYDDRIRKVAEQERNQQDLIDSLEEKELVKRVADSKDRRKNYLMVTKLGYKVIDQYLKIAEDMMIVIQEGLSQEDIDTFQRVVGHITAKAKEM